MDILLNYREYGSGRPLVLLHGNGEDSSVFTKQIEAFGNFRLICVDTRGHGKSPRGTQPFCFETFVEDLKNLLDHLNLTKINLLGFSDGGNIALMFSSKYPEYISRLIVSGANLTPSGCRPSLQVPIVLAYGLLSLFACFNKELVYKKEIIGLMVKEPHIKKEDLKRISCPTLVMAGTKDIIKEKETRSIATSIPLSKLAILPGDHFLLSKEPEAFNYEVLRFLNAEE